MRTTLPKGRSTSGVRHRSLQRAELSLRLIKPGIKTCGDKSTAECRLTTGIIAPGIHFTANWVDPRACVVAVR